MEKSSKGQILLLERVLLWQGILGSFWVRVTPSLGSDEEDGRGGKQDGGAVPGQWRCQLFPWGNSSQMPKLEKNKPLSKLSLGLLGFLDCSGFPALCASGTHAPSQRGTHPQAGMTLEVRPP